VEATKEGTEELKEDMGHNKEAMEDTNVDTEVKMEDTTVVVKARLNLVQVRLPLKMRRYISYRILSMPKSSREGTVKAVKEGTKGMLVNKKATEDNKEDMELREEVTMEVAKACSNLEEDTLLPKMRRYISFKILSMPKSSREGTVKDAKEAMETMKKNMKEVDKVEDTEVKTEASREDGNSNQVKEVPVTDGSSVLLSSSAAAMVK